jgi:hypothetical protein
MWLAYCATFCLCPTQPPESPPTRKTNPPQWEYKIIERDEPGSIPRASIDFDTARKNCINELNKLGNAGWEFAAVANGQPPSLGPVPEEPYYVYFRRATDQARRQKWEYKLVDLGEL